MNHFYSKGKSFTASYRNEAFIMATTSSWRVDLTCEQKSLREIQIKEYICQRYIVLLLR